MTSVSGPPRLSRTVVPRPRLESRLDEALAEQLTIVRAPIGYGKTTLVAHWLRSTEAAGRPAVWIDLETVSPDADSFWNALDDRQPAGPPSGDEPIVLVLDGYDEQWDSRLSGELTRLIGRSPGLRLVILTRTMTNFEAPMTAAALDLCVITADDLALTRDELDRASAALGLTVTTATLDTIARITHGWPRAVRALLRVIAAERSEPAADALDRALLHVSGELLNRLDIPPGDLTALQRAAAAPYLTPGILGHLAPDADGDTVISAVERAGLGSWTYRDGRGRPVFEILEPVKRELLSRPEVAEPSARERLTHSVAGALELDGDAVSALRHALRATDITLAELIVMRRLGSVFGADAGEYFRILQPIDQAALAASSVLLTVTGLLTEYHGDGCSAAMPYYLAAADLPPSPLRPSPLRSGEAGNSVWAELASMIALRKAGRMAEAELQLGSIQAADAALPAYAWAEIGMTRLRLGNTEQAVVCFRRSALLAGHDPGLEVFALGSLAVAHAVRGEIDQAEAACGRVGEREGGEREGGDGHLTPQSLVPARIARHLVATERGRHPDAGELVVAELGELPSGELPLGELRPYAVFARALRSVCRGERRSALDLLGSELMSRNSPPASNVEHAPLVALRATLMIAEGNVTDAQHVITSFPDGTGALRAVAARLALMTRDFRGALALADELLMEEPAARGLVDALLVRGSAIKRIGNRSAACDTFEQAARVAESHHLATPFALAIGEDVRGLSATPGSPPHAAHDLVPLLGESAMAAELTRRERVVLERLASNASLDDIAASLVVSVNTVKSQARSVYRKLGASSRHEAVGIALDGGLLRAADTRGRAPRAGGERIARGGQVA